CPTDSIQFGELDELRERADKRLAKLQEQGWNGAQLYGRDPDDGVGGFGAFFLLLDEPEVYGLPPDPVVTTRDLPGLWAATAVAHVVSPILLISDLGRPERFLNMFRVFKVTSPMSVGSWILGASGTASGAAALLELLGKWRPLKYTAEVVSALTGAPLATYTGTLIADTAIPVWHEARRELPFLFGASAVASAGAARSEEHTSELQSHLNLVCRLLLEK